MLELVHGGESGGDRLVVGCREIVVPKTSDDVQLLCWIVVELCVSVGLVLRVLGIVQKLVCSKIVVHEIRSDRKCIFANKMVVDGMANVLNVAVVVVVSALSAGVEVCLVVLVESIRHFEIAAVSRRVTPLQTCAVGVEVITVCVALAVAEEISAASHEFQSVACAECEPLLNVECLLTIQALDIRFVLVNCFALQNCQCFF